MTLNEYIKSKKDIELSNSQKEAINKISDFLKSDTHCFILKGFAGTGKTFIIALIKEYLDSIDYQTLIYTPTGRAAKVVADKIKSPHVAMTIHRGIYSFHEFKNRMKDLNKEIKKLELKQKEEPLHITEKNQLRNLNIEKRDLKKVLKEIEVYGKGTFQLSINKDKMNSIYFVDEASMLSNKESSGRNKNVDIKFGNERFVTDLISYVDLRNALSRKIIFVGDSSQLTPVNMNYSPALSAEYISKEFGLKTDEYQLTDVFRQDIQSGILKNASKLRKDISSQIYHNLSLDVNQYQDIEEISSNDAINTYESTYNADNLDSNLLITHSNGIANNYNTRIRKKLFNVEDDKSKSNRLVEGERLICIQNNYHHNIFNGEFLKVIKIGKSEKKVRDMLFNALEPFDKEEWKNQAKEDDNGNLRVPIALHYRTVTVEYINSFGNLEQKELIILENNLIVPDRQLWYMNYYALFATNNTDKNYLYPIIVKYGYAATCHKAQGGEWDHVIIDFGTHLGLNKNTQDYFRWCYTAITRGKKKDYFINKPHSVNQREVEKHAHLDRLLS
jgi:ATP-dependent exoDNAse (exonuclease V) alpha subunit